MTFDEYRTLLTDVLNPDKQAEAVIKITDGLQADLTERDTYKTERETLTNIVNSLRDTNAKLVLRVTEPIKEQPEPETEKTAEESFTELVDIIKREE